MLAAIGIANAGSDRADSLYLDRSAPAHGGLDGCETPLSSGALPGSGRRACAA
jgi:hypothetical protein